MPWATTRSPRDSRYRLLETPIPTTTARSGCTETFSVTASPNWSCSAPVSIMRRVRHR